MVAEAAHPQFLGFIFEDKGPGWGDLFFKVVHAQMKRKHLPADRRGGFKIVQDFQMIGWAGKSGESLVSSCHLNRTADHQRADFRFLIAKSNFLNRLHERLR